MLHDFEQVMTEDVVDMVDLLKDYSVAHNVLLADGDYRPELAVNMDQGIEMLLLDQ